MVAQSWTPLCHALEFKLAPQVVFHVIECGVASIDTAGVTALHAWELAFPLRAVNHVSLAAGWFASEASIGHRFNYFTSVVG